jgi:hypothetical protein
VTPRPPKKKIRQCRLCSAEIHRPRGPLFCDGKDCRKVYYERTGKIPPGRPKGSGDTDLVKVSKALVFGKLYDPVRDILREEVRATISQHVKDNVLGMTEVLTDLLPLVYSSLAQDVQSEDSFVRQKAISLVMKYAMPLAKEEPKVDDSRVINVVHHVPIPDTAFGHAIEGELVSLPSGVEPFEADWPTCRDCHERKHPQTGRFETTRPDDGPQTTTFLCHACEWRAKVRQGAIDPTHDHDVIRPDPGIDPPTP